jgi:S1-C subfamily serine protease
VERADDISRAAAKKHAGEAIELTILRGGRSTKVRVTLAPLDDNSV